MIDFTAVKNLASKFTVTGAQKAHIDRLVFELGILEKNCAGLSEKLIGAEVKIAELMSENKDLHAKLAQYEQRGEGLNEEETKILQFFFKSQESSCEQASASLSIPLPEVTHFVKSLSKHGLLRHSRGAVSGLYQALYKITHEGSSKIMKKG